jgi:hypothetical protein
MRAGRRFLLLVLLLALNSGSAYGHGTAAITIDVTEVAPGRAVVHSRRSDGRLPREGEPRIDTTFDAPCTTQAEEREAFAGDPVILVQCPGSLDGARLVVRGLGALVSEAIVVVELWGGRRASRVLTADSPAWQLPPGQGRLALARAYLGAGLAHIALGYDHLLFLLALVLLLRRPRAVLLAETAFTISHSLSFSATALGLVHIPASLAEALIALSLVLLALDVGRPESAGMVSARQGAALALVFGLVHGLGFASGLSEVGLPDHDVAVALLGFAAGIEAGQLMFLALALAALWPLARRAPELLHGRLAPALAVGIGGVSSYWFIERVALCIAR